MPSLRRLLRFLRPYRRAALFAVLLLVGVAAADLAIPRLVQRIIDVGIATQNLRAIATTSLLMMALSLSSATMAIINTVLAVRAAQSYGADLRDALFRHVQSLSFADLDRLETGKLLIRLTSDITQVQMVVLLSLRLLVRGPLMIVGSVIFMVLTSPRLAAWMLLILPLTAGIITLFALKVPALFRRVQQRLDRLNQVLQENLAGVRVVKAFVRGGHESARFDTANVDLMQQSIYTMRILSLLIPTMSLVLNLGTVLVVWLGGLDVQLGGMTVGRIVAFVNYLLSTMFPLMMLGMMVNQIFAAEASSERIIEVFDTDPAIQDRPDARPWDGRVQEHAPSPASIRLENGPLATNMSNLAGRVAFENVSFCYDGDGGDLDEFEARASGPLQEVLSGINLVAEPGQQVAILGATGSGKSTLVHLIPRFYDVTAGRVTIDDVDVRDLELDSLRHQVSVALQEAVLFTGTVRDNIRYGRPDAGDEEVVAAAQAAQAHEFITDLPDGYDTLVGQRGVNLSGGQKQRISIARALLVNPRVLILDDSTSAVDFETENRIQAALELLLRKASRSTTIFVVAQRISTVLSADKIIVLDKGAIAAEGTHEELLASSPIYQEIYASQLGDGNGHHRGEVSHGQ
jgi:ATP-binding cassette, subfamily B, multidrug efflux pump